MKRNSGKQGRTRKPRVRKGEPARLEAGIRGDGISVYWETDAIQGQRCCALLYNEDVDVDLLISLFDLDPEAPPIWMPHHPVFWKMLGGPMLFRIGLEERPSYEEFVRIHDRLVECQRKLLQPTQREALDLLADTDQAIREYALSQITVWRKRWKAVGPETIAPREAHRYVER